MSSLLLHAEQFTQEQWHTLVPVEMWTIQRDLPLFLALAFKPETWEQWEKPSLWHTWETGLTCAQRWDAAWALTLSLFEHGAEGEQQQRATRLLTRMVAPWRHDAGMWQEQVLTRTRQQLFLMKGEETLFNKAPLVHFWSHARQTIFLVETVAAPKALYEQTLGHDRLSLYHLAYLTLAPRLLIWLKQQEVPETKSRDGRTPLFWAKEHLGPQLHRRLEHCALEVALSEKEKTGPLEASPVRRRI